MNISTERYIFFERYVTVNEGGWRHIQIVETET